MKYEGDLLAMLLACKTYDQAAKKGLVPFPDAAKFKHSLGTVRKYTTDAAALDACRRYGRPKGCYIVRNSIYLRWESPTAKRTKK